jgi:hypothetical protein
MTGLFELLTGDEFTTHDFAIDQFAIVIEGQRYLNALKAALAADQRFADHETSLFKVAQVIAHVNAGLYGLTAAIAAHINMVTRLILLLASAQQRFH